jgi:hypothetical protein
MLAVMVFAPSPSFASAPSLPDWVLIKPGAVGYLADEGDKFDPPGRRIVCKNLEAYLHRNADDDAGCVERRAFGLVRVLRIVEHAAPVYAKGKIVLKEPIVAIASLSANWSGVVNGLAVLPVVPIGKRLVLHPGALGSRSPLVEVDREEKPVDGFVMGEATTVEVIGQHAPDNDYYRIRVKILTGKHRNEKVWTLLFTVYPANWMQDPANIVP